MTTVRPGAIPRRDAAPGTTRATPGTPGHTRHADHVALFRAHKPGMMLLVGDAVDGTGTIRPI